MMETAARAKAPSDARTGTSSPSGSRTETATSLQPRRLARCRQRAASPMKESAADGVAEAEVEAAELGRAELAGGSASALPTS